MQQWVTIRHAVGPEQEKLRAIGERLNEMCGGMSFSATPGLKKVEDLLATVHDLTTLQRSLDNNDPLATALGRLLLGWANALDPEVHRGERCMLAAAARESLFQTREELALDYAESAAILADCAQADDDLEAAKRHAYDAWRVIVRNRRIGNWYIASTEVRISRGLVAVGMFEQAELLLLPAYEQLNIQLGAQHPDTRAARSQLRILYLAWGRSDKALEYEEPPETKSSNRQNR